MQLFLQFKWMILLLSEIVAWISTFLMFYSRYWLQSNKSFILFSVIAFVTGWIPHLTLMIINLIESFSVGVFELSILALLLYGFTFGKKHIIKIDKSMSELANKKRNKVTQ